MPKSEDCPQDKIPLPIQEAAVTLYALARILVNTLTNTKKSDCTTKKTKNKKKTNKIDFLCTKSLWLVTAFLKKTRQVGEQSLTLGRWQVSRLHLLLLKNNLAIQSPCLNYGTKITSQFLFLQLTGLVLSIQSMDLNHFLSLTVHSAEKSGGIFAANSSAIFFCRQHFLSHDLHILGKQTLTLNPPASQLGLRTS